MSNIDKKILEEIQRYKNINRYINEQDVPLAPPVDPAVPPVDPAAPPADPAAAGAPPAQPTPPAPQAPPQVVDPKTDPDVEKLDSDGKSTEKDENKEEVEVTDLVDSQKNIEKKQEEYFDNLFGQISKLEAKLAEMDQIVNKLNTLENKIEKYREKSPQEKLELRTYDSYPFNQKLSDFFTDKKAEMELTGKRDYVLTPDDVTDINSAEIKKTFQPDDEDELT